MSLGLTRTSLICFELIFVTCVCVCGDILLCVSLLVSFIEKLCSSGQRVLSTVVEGSDRSQFQVSSPTVSLSSPS